VANPYTILLQGLMTVWKCIFNSILKNALARGTPGYCKWHPRVPRHPGWEPLSYSFDWTVLNLPSQAGDDFKVTWPEIRFTSRSHAQYALFLLLQWCAVLDKNSCDRAHTIDPFLLMFWIAWGYLVERRPKDFMWKQNRSNA